MSVLADLPSRYRVAAGPLQAERRLELVLVALLVIVLLQLLWLAVRAAVPAAVPAIPPAADSLAVRDGATTGAVSAEDSALVQARPLFWELRRPTGRTAAAAVETDSSAAETAAKALRDLDVTGIYGSGTAGGAIVVYRGNERRIAVGDELAGWRLDSVDGNEVRWMSAGREDVRLLRPRAVTAPDEAAVGAGSQNAPTAQADPSPAPPAQTSARPRAKRSLSAGAVPARSTATAANGK